MDGTQTMTQAIMQAAIEATKAVVETITAAVVEDYVL